MGAYSFCCICLESNIITVTVVRQGRDNKELNKTQANKIINPQVSEFRNTIRNGNKRISKQTQAKTKNYKLNAQGT